MYCDYLLYIVFIILFILIFFIINKKYCESFDDVSQSSKPNSISSSYSLSSSSIPSPFTILKSTILKEYNLDAEAMRNLSNISSKIYSNNNLTIPGNLNILGNLNIFPVGQVAAYTCTTDPPGWLICDGRSVSINQYLNLYNILNGPNPPTSTTFNIPNYSGLFLRGIKNDNLNTYSKDSIQDHTHSQDGNHLHNISFKRKYIKYCPRINKDRQNKGIEKCYRDYPGPSFAPTSIDDAWILGFNQIALDKIPNGRGLRGTNYPLTVEQSTTGVSLSTIIGVSNNPNVSNETRPYNWTINWIIKY